MQAVRYNFSIPKYLMAKGFGRWSPAVYTSRFSSALSLDDVPEPVLPGPDWLAIEPTYSGICGTDIGTITGKTSPALEPFASFPATLGHEVVGRVVEVGAQVSHVRVGDRVVVDPWISCRVRGLDPCPPCRSGTPYLCRRAAEGRFGPGMLIGFCQGLPGGWSRRMVAHASQAFLVPKDLSDETAVLIEPLSVAVHGVLRALRASGAHARAHAHTRAQVHAETESRMAGVAVSNPASVGNAGFSGFSGFSDSGDLESSGDASAWAHWGPDTHVLVVGAGAIGLAVVAAIRLLGLACRITVLARYPFQGELATALGADEVVASRRGTAVAAAQSVTGAQVYRPRIGPPVITGGFDVVFDCVGTTSSIADSLRVAREHGRVVVLGGAGELEKVDWTFVWMRELEVVGSCGYGYEPGYGRHTYEVLFDLLSKKRDLPLHRLITHRFPLSAYRDAIRCNLERAKTGAVKTVFCESP